MRALCCICRDFDRKAKEIVSHGPMCRSCAFCFFSWKRGKKWLKTVRA